MTQEPAFASLGTRTDDIEVRLSYKIVELFSEGLYTSPHKAVEELVANSFDAGARCVHVLLSPNMHSHNATITVIDDGEGMDQEDLTRHWLIGTSNKRNLPKLPRGRQQIGKFGIGKLATYVLANRLTHVSKKGAKYYSTSMDYNVIDRRVDRDVEPKAPVTIALRELTKVQAHNAVKAWTESAEFKASGTALFGEESPTSWTISIMSSLKTKVHEIKPGTLKWVLRTMLPLRPDFGVWLNGEKLTPSKEEKHLLKRWTLGKGLVELPRPSPKEITPSEDKNVSLNSEHRFGLNVPGLGRITGYAETYKELLTRGKSGEISRSHGFFVYVYGRLLNVVNGHFGISPDELRHGTFGRFRLVVHMDGLDAELRSNREAIGEGPLLETAQDVLRAIFNAARSTIERHDEDEDIGVKLARKFAASPSSLSRKPIVELARAVAEGKSKARHLIVPSYESPEKREEFLTDLDQRAQEREHFVTGVNIDFQGSSQDGIVRFDTATGCLRLNGWHPFVAAFHDEFINKALGQPLEMFAMAEVLAEAYLYSIDIKPEKIDAFLSTRDQLLRHLANESGRQSASSVANALMEARNSPDRLEESVCNAFRSLGFDVTPLGKKAQPDGVATAHLAGDSSGNPQSYSVSLEAKSKERAGAKASAKAIDIAAVIRHRDQYRCQHAVVVAPAFPTSQGDNSALGDSIKDDRRKSAAVGENRTITLLAVDDLAKLVRLRPVKQVGLRKIREFFRECSLPEQSADWIELVHKSSVEHPPYRKIVETIENLQRKFREAPVDYSALRVELSHLDPPIEYQRDDQLSELCNAMTQMAPKAIVAGLEKVELDQSSENVIAAIEAAIQDYTSDKQ